MAGIAITLQIDLFRQQFNWLDDNEIFMIEMTRGTIPFHVARRFSMPLARKSEIREPCPKAVHSLRARSIQCSSSLNQELPTQKRASVHCSTVDTVLSGTV